jgi:hypothetical protein
MPDQLFREITSSHKSDHAFVTGCYVTCHDSKVQNPS